MGKQTEPGAPVSIFKLSGASDKQIEATFRKWFELYYSSSISLREKFKRNDIFYQLRHWELVSKRDEWAKMGFDPVFPVLYSTIDGTHSDLMDAMPEPVLLGEQAQDAPKAKVLTQLTRYILNRRRYSRTWRDAALSLLVYGTAVQETFWDKTLLGGLGDVNVQTWNVRNFLWNPTVEDIQDSEAVFKVSFQPFELMRARYPDVQIDRGTDVYDYHSFYTPKFDKSSQDRPVMVTEMWWKEYENNALGVALPKLYMAKFVGSTLVESFTEKPVYDHGAYPFVTATLTPVAGQVWGLGFPDLFGSMQQITDMLNRIMIENAEASSKIRLLVNQAAGINERELMDWSNPIVHGDRIDDNALKMMHNKPLAGQTFALMQYAIDAMKEESGQNAFVRGEGGKSVTAASAIMALQEAGSKRSRNIVSRMYDAFQDVVDLMLRLIAQFYDEERTFAITEPGQEPVDVAVDRSQFARDDGTQIEFDISVNVQKKVAYKSVYNDERIFQLLQIGAISPAIAIKMMDFDRKDEFLAAIAEEQQQQAIMQELLARHIEQKVASGEPVPEFPGQAGGTPSPPAPDFSRMDTGASGVRMG